MAEYGKEALAKVSEFDASNFTADTQRQLKKVGLQPLSTEEEQDLGSIIAEMGSIYGSSEVCAPDDLTQCYQLEPGLTNIMAESTDYAERTYYWQAKTNFQYSKMSSNYIFSF